MVLDLVLERRPPFSPAECVREFAAALKPYRIRKVVGDRYGGDVFGERFREAGLAYEVSEKTRSDLYAELLPMLNSKTVRLLDDPRLATQLLGLERRTSRGGRDTNDHGPRGKDDVINSAAGALVLAARGRVAGDSGVS